jgi:hypothetical protein
VLEYLELVPNGLGVALGANTSTFNGLSGLGDLVLTCSDDLSRNRQFGKALAKNQKLVQILLHFISVLICYRLNCCILNRAIDALDHAIGFRGYRLC